MSKTKLKTIQDAIYNTRWKAGSKNAGLATDEEIAKAVLAALEALKPVPITYDEIKAGDIIRTDYPGGFSVGVALTQERLYDDDPDAPETIWRMDGMEYVGQSIGSWHEAGKLTRIPEREVSPLDEEAKGWIRAAQAEREKDA